MHRHVSQGLSYPLDSSSFRLAMPNRDFSLDPLCHLLLLFATTRSVFKSVKVSVVEIAKRTN